MNGEGEVVAGIALQRFGSNALDVINNVKARINDMASSLPEGVTIKPVYDRSDLIYRAIKNLDHTLIEESIVVAVVCFVFLLHARSALVAILVLPVGILMAFAAMYGLGTGSNIMSLGGLAIAIGAMVDAAIVMIENAHKHLERATPDESRFEILVDAACEVGPSLFFSLLIITVSFLPINRGLIHFYRPIIAKVLEYRKVTIALALLVLLISIYPAMKLGSEFMPNLNEGTLLYMPITLPGISITKSAELMQTQDRIIKSFPEVESVFGKDGRAETATDPAPTEMFETIINLKPQEEWPSGMTLDGLIAEMDKSLQFPGVSNAWTQPIRARIDMLSTGIRTPLGIKVFGKDLAQIEDAAKQIETVLHSVKGTSSAYAERITGGYYLNIDPDRMALARYGLTIGDVQDVITTALGGEAVTTTVEGRERYTVNVRYPRDFRSDPQAIAEQILVPAASGAMVPLGELAHVSLSQGPSTIRTENAQLAAYVYMDIRDIDIGNYVANAQKAIHDQVKLPSGVYLVWSGQFEYMQRAIAKLQIVVPVTLLIILTLLYLNFGRMTETLIVFLSLPFSLVGGLWLMYWLGFNFSVAVAVGFIALAGVAAQTGVVMVVYLDHAYEKISVARRTSGQPVTMADLYAAIMEGAVDRVRPKMMTVTAIMAGLLPIMWSHGTGSEVMQRIAVPMLGGMVSSTILTLVVIPAVYALVKHPDYQEVGR